MDPRDFFRGIFGIPRSHRPHDGHGYRGDGDDDDGDLRRGRRHFDHNDDDDESGAFSFHVFTNPLEMEKFFDSQMDQILKGFGFGRGLDGFGAFGGMQLPQPPSRPDSEEGPSAGSREFMLKEDNRFGGHEYRGEQDAGRKDSDMDEEVEERGLDGILAPPRGGGAIAPFFGGGDGGGGGGIFPGGLFPRIFPGFPGFGYPEQFGHPQNPGGPGARSESFSFGSSMTRRVIQLPDGSVEEHSSARESDGTERVTVTRRLGDHSQTETTLRHPDGTEERTVSGSEDFEKVWADRRGGEPEADPRPSDGLELWKRDRQSTDSSIFDKFFGTGRSPRQW